MLEFFSDALDKVQPWELAEGTHGKLLRPIDPQDMERWKREGTRGEMREIEAVTHEAIDRFGYERTFGALETTLLTNRARARHHLREPRQALARSRSPVESRQT